jgi:hypothetical protein
MEQDPVQIIAERLVFLPEITDLLLEQFVWLIGFAYELINRGTT